MGGSRCDESNNFLALPAYILCIYLLSGSDPLSKKPAEIGGYGMADLLSSSSLIIVSVMAPWFADG